MAFYEFKKESWPMNKWTRVRYQPNLPLYENTYVTCSLKHRELARAAAREGAVLLKNEKKILPFQPRTRLAMFGRGVFDYVKGGGGSGEVAVRRTKTLYDALQNYPETVDVYEPLCAYYKQDLKQQYAQGAVPGMTMEPILPPDLLQAARTFADTALIVLGRFSGEGWDRSDVEYFDCVNPWETESIMPKLSACYYPDGDFYLTVQEKAMVEQVVSRFPKVAVVLNIGGVVDTRWIKNDPRIGAALTIWQGGMEGAAAAAELLCGKATPSGKLADTFAGHVEDYPCGDRYHESVDYVEYEEDIYVGYRYFETIPGQREKVCYPFGFGLSYTSFSIELEEVQEESEQIRFRVGVINQGERSGKEVVQVYFSAPQGLLQKPARVLGAFAKTRELMSGESQQLTLCVKKSSMASFDDLGKICKSAFVLEPGNYSFSIGNSIRAPEIAYHMTLCEPVVVEQLHAKCVPNKLKRRLLADGTLEALPQGPEYDMNECVIPKMTPGSEEALVPAIRARERYMLMKPYKEGVQPFDRVAEGKLNLDEFMAQISDRDLLELLGGQPNLSVADAQGYGNLPEYGVPSIMTADGPAGLRLHTDRGVYTTNWPCATMIACTWNTDLAEEIGRTGAEEVKENNLAIWLAPAVNIHRNPLCGRNFEYYSEDPLLAGKMGAAAVRGIQSQHIGAAVKHFACNNKETNRKNSDSRVSERALREIYLKVFEIVVKDAQPWVIMSAYNAINGHRCSENHELLEDILREEWGFQGMVTSDWWTRGEHYKEILAGNDVKMACGFPERVEQAMTLGAVKRSDLERCARRVLELILKID